MAEFDDNLKSKAAAEALVDQGPAGDDPAGPADAPDRQDDPVTALARERDTLRDRLLRTAAEFDNYRKRVDRDRREQAEAAMAGAIEELLPIVDDLERALEAPAGSDAGTYRKGVELIHRQMTELLRKRGVTSIETVGADFDPRVHQAVAHEVSATHRDGEVIEEFRRGYKLGDRLLRAAMVKVAKA